MNLWKKFQNIELLTNLLINLKKIIINKFNNDFLKVNY